jgi:hypothetical protein
MARRAHTLDIVKLLRDVGGFPAGTVGAVVAEEPDAALVEVVTDGRVDEHGLPERDLFEDFLSVPYSALDVIEPAATTAR